MFKGCILTSILLLIREGGPLGNRAGGRFFHPCPTITKDFSAAKSSFLNNGEEAATQPINRSVPYLNYPSDDVQNSLFLI